MSKRALSIVDSIRGMKAEILNAYVKDSRGKRLFRDENGKLINIKEFSENLRLTHSELIDVDTVPVANAVNTVLFQEGFRMKKSPRGSKPEPVEKLVRAVINDIPVTIVLNTIDDDVEILDVRQVRETSVDFQPITSS